MEIFILNTLDDIENVPSMLGVYSDRAKAMSEYKNACDTYKTLELAQYVECRGKFEFIKVLKTKGFKF